MAVPTKEGSRYVDHADILALQADGSYTWLLCTDGKRLLVSRNLRYLSTALPSSLFFRSHRKHLINLGQVAELLNHGGCRVRMKGGLELPVARSCRSALVEALGQV
ncbi:MAG: LytTR family transcriptional regulator [Bacteroidetes bacterium]|nr:LytTR family transcriptional regulator [Bacteroidota bacterium]